MAESRGRPDRAGGSQRRSADSAAAARCCPWAARRPNDAPARIGCVPAGIRRCRGGGVHPVMRANSATELSIVHALNPPPAAIRWLVTGLFWLGSAGVIAFLAVLALLVPRLAAVRRITVAAVLAWEPAFFLAQFSARRAVGHRRASRSGYQLSGHAACGHHRRRGDRAAFPEPLLAPPSVVSHHGSGDRRGHRRLGASGQMLSPALRSGGASPPACTWSWDLRWACLLRKR